MGTLHADAVDLAHLDRYTGGDRALNKEVLRLFDSQCDDMLSELESAANGGDARAWHMAAHTLKGASRGVGAHALAKAAADAEHVDPADGPALSAAAAKIGHEMGHVRRFIARFLG
jgi:HPt (histidine-containing phosphotransfer) domain-containing protein